MTRGRGRLKCTFSAVALSPFGACLLWTSDSSGNAPTASISCASKVRGETPVDHILCVVVSALIGILAGPEVSGNYRR